MTKYQLKVGKTVATLLLIAAVLYGLGGAFNLAAQVIQMVNQ